MSTMISVEHRSLSGRAILLIMWSTEFESEIDLFLLNIKLFYKFTKSQNNAHVTFGSISTAYKINESRYAQRFNLIYGSSRS